QTDPGNPDYIKNYDQIQSYAKKYNATDAFDDVASNRGNAKDMQSSHQKDFQSQLQHTKDAQQIAQSNTHLTDLGKKTTAQCGAGAVTSDQLLDPGAHGMEFFQYFIPCMKAWTGNAPDLAKDIQAVYDNLRGIQLAKFRTDASQLSTSYGKLTDITQNLSSQ